MVPREREEHLRTWVLAKMGSVVVDRERRQQVNKRMYYLPDVDEYNSSSEPLTGELCVTDRGWLWAEVNNKDERVGYKL